MAAPGRDAIIATNAHDDRPARVMMFTYAIPHYRAAVYRRLSRTPGLDFTICAGRDRSTITQGTVALADEVDAAEGINWQVISSRRLTGPLLRGYEWQPEAVGLVFREKLDAVICFGNKSASNWLIRVICWARRIPILEWSQGIKAPERGLKWMIRRFYMGWARVLLLYGHMAAEFFVSHGFASDRVFVVHNSLDHDTQVRIRNAITDSDIHEVRVRYGAGADGARLIFHSGRLEKRKNLDLLLDAVKALRAKGRTVCAVLIGDGPEEPELRRYARSNGVADIVHFAGACYDEETLGRLFAASDLCVVPGALGLLAMHSLVYGTPILCCENEGWLHGPEVETVVEGETGGFFRYGDLAHLTERLDELLFERPCKPRMSDNCRRMIDNGYTPEYQQRTIVSGINHVLPPARRIPMPEEDACPKETRA